MGGPERLEPLPIYQSGCYRRRIGGHRQGAIAFANLGATVSLAVLLKEEKVRRSGGLWGATLFGWLRIELLFVLEASRVSSIGSAIMHRAEALAAARGCIGASLDTRSFQARRFYEKLGYSLVGIIGDCPPENARHLGQRRFPSTDELADSLSFLCDDRRGSDLRGQSRALAESSLASSMIMVVSGSTLARLREAASSNLSKTADAYSSACSFVPKSTRACSIGTWLST